MIELGGKAVMNKKILLCCFLAGLVSGCKTTATQEAPQVAQPSAAVVKEKKTVEKTIDGITSSDFKRAIQTAVRNMVQSGTLDNPKGEKYVVAVSYIVDTTKKGFDTADIKQKLGAELAAGRKVRVVSMTSKNQPPQIIVAGRITQRTAFVRGGKRQEYYLHIVLTEAKSGIKLGENTTPVVRTSN